LSSVSSSPSQKTEQCLGSVDAIMNFCGLFNPILGNDGNKKDVDDDGKSTASKPIPYDPSDDVCVSPFIKYNSDGYRWPDLFSELDECLEACILIFPLAELRKMARAGELENPSRILALPLTREFLSPVLNASVLTASCTVNVHSIHLVL